MLRDRLSDIASDLRYRFRATFRRATMERDLADELAFHLDREVAKLEASGMAGDEARRRARLSFGGLERFKDESRDVNGVRWLDHLRQDLRYSLRGLRARPMFTAGIVVTLGLGLGANIAMFGVVDQLLLSSPRYLRAADRVHRIYLSTTTDGRTETTATTEYLRYLDFRRYARDFDELAVLSPRTFAVGTGEDARELPVAVVSATFWNFFDARPAAGRFFTAREDAVPAGAPVAVISYAYWQTRYGGSPDVIGRPIQVGPVQCTIIGVTPVGFTGVADESVPVAFVPAALYGYGASVQRSRPDYYYTTYNWSWLSVIARRKPGVSVAAATADLTNAYRASWENERAMSRIRSIEEARPVAVAGPLMRERGPMASPVSRVAVWIAGVAAVVLLIACANVANLLLVRGIARRREIALRLALGASRGRLVGQLLTESLVLAVLGSAAGLAVAQWGGALLRHLFLDTSTDVMVVRDERTLLFAGAVTVLVAIVIGVVPALQSTRASLAPTLKAGAREGTYRRSRARTFLLVTQGALSVVLLVGAGLFVRSLQAARSMRLGYDIDPVMVVSPNLRGTRLGAAERADLVRRMVVEANAMPEVVSAARGVSIPLWSTEVTRFYVPGVDSVRKLGQFTIQMASADYFETLGTRIRRGRGFTEADRADGALVVVVSEGMAAAVWPGEDALGKCVMLDERTAPCRTVVGIAENVHQESFRERESLQLYFAIEQLRPEDAVLFVRTRGDARAHTEAVRRRLQTLMPGAAYVSPTAMRDIVDPEQRSWQFGATMFVLFGVLALVLALVGLYSVIAFTVAQRTHEIGVRIALGAGAGKVVRLVLAEGWRFAAIGIVIGGGLALAASRWVGPLLFSVSARDPLVYGVVAVVLLVTALAASAIPARRAARVDPNVALRVE